MYLARLRTTLFGVLTLMTSFFTPLIADEPSGISGKVLNPQGEGVHHAIVLVVQTGHTADTDHQGRYEIRELKPGTYDLFAEAANFTSRVNRVVVEPGRIAQVDLALELSPVRDSVTVTARGRHETTFDAVQAVNSLDAFDIAEQLSVSVGEVLEGELGIAKRSFGPGSSRPVIRGFDGDRVLVLEDGVSAGSLGAQSGDHGEPIDPGQLERLEVVKGPATLLYGSSAIGGVVNAISRHHEMHKHHHQGLRGQITSGAGSNNTLLGANVSAEYGSARWMFWAGGGGQRAGDYETPEGKVGNSKSRVSNGSVGLGWFGDSFYLSGGVKLRDGRYGIPFATFFHEEHGVEERLEEEHPGAEAEPEAIDVDWRYHNVRFDTGLTGIGSSLDSIRIALSYTRWRHHEIESLPGEVEMIGTAFDNQQFTYRADIDHHYRRAAGSFGLWGTTRSYSSSGVEALSPPVDQTGIAAFALEEVNLERVKFQFGGRLEHLRYSPKETFERQLGEDDLAQAPAGSESGHQSLLEPMLLQDRNFTGLSGSAGARVRLWKEGALVGHFTSAYRAPALEELYNFGPHVGNLAFEIGNPGLGGERSNGFDLSLRHAGDRMRAEGNFFFYRISDFIFAAPTGHLEGGLFEVEYSQDSTRFRGAEFGFDVALREWCWLTLGYDLVDAELTRTSLPLPRIPPMRGRLGLDFRYDGLSLRPELVVASDRREVFPTETQTAGYGVINLDAAYTLPRQHFVHHFALEIFNIGDRLYRNHVSFIKDLAPEMGRGVKVSYAVKFF